MLLFLLLAIAVYGNGASTRKLAPFMCKKRRLKTIGMPMNGAIWDALLVSPLASWWI